jgi:hypothetical protein
MNAPKRRSGFLLCIRSEGSEDLEPRKAYEFLHDPEAAREGYARVIDESGEDYLYPAEYFVELPADIERELRSASRDDASGARTPKSKKPSRAIPRKVARRAL